jgi:two-component system chemotaxis sensor kinase CheA
VALPLDAVRSASMVRDQELARTPGGKRLVHEGESLPFATLHELLVQGGDAGTRGSWPCLIVAAADKRAALAADRLLGTEQVVLRPLPRHAPARHTISGIALDGSGVPQLVLDPDGCVEAALQAPGTMTSSARRRAPVLIIDDSVTTRMLEQSILESAGYEVELASSAEEGLVKARAREHALFLVDVEMPGMNGFEFVELTRKDPELRATPAILVTSRDAPSDRARGASAGAAAYVVKSEFDQVALLDTIERLSR